MLHLTIGGISLPIVAYGGTDATCLLQTVCHECQTWVVLGTRNTVEQMYGILVVMVRIQSGAARQHDTEQCTAQNSYGFSGIHVYRFLIEQVTDGKHNPVGGDCVDKILIGCQMTLSVLQVICVLSFIVVEQVAACNLLEDAPVLTEKIGKV